jgi:predicted lipoprotein with Yx(FWY)xxD motif
MRKLSAGTLIVGVGLLVAACSSSGGGATAAPTGTPTTAPTTTDTAPPTATGAAIGLASTSLGDIVVDGLGLTLYIFTPDTAGASTCYGDCAASWPPLLADAAPIVGADLDATKFGTTTRTDGGTQVTFGGMPLYHFVGDKAAGDTNGQGVGGKWYVVGADGAMIK